MKYKLYINNKNLQNFYNLGNISKSRRLFKLIVYLIFLAISSIIVLARDEIDMGLFLDIVYITMIFIFLIISAKKLGTLKPIPSQA